MESAIALAIIAGMIVMGLMFGSSDMGFFEAVVTLGMALGIFATIVVILNK